MTEELAPGQDMTADTAGTIYRFVNKDTNAEFLIQQVRYEGSEVKIGDVIEIHVPNSKPAYFTVDSVEGGETVVVRLVRARNNLWKTLLILAILGASWFIIAYVLELIF
ncbi:MAG: hypothetical protein WBN83_02500 [Desulfoprunum sp.]|jgi:hypothetical protein|uniref:hypothetical protein n=1 Tax=Desulfoprunum sp. TaxID=2020866 RepID=UPI00052CECAB|nr:hypothetical protein JT06_01390 [Desulfobulbus sp. Tol-SR]